MASNDSDPRYVSVAEIARPHGIRGEVKLKVYNLDSELLASRPPIRLAHPTGQVTAATIRAVRAVPGAMLMRIAGVDDRDAAEALRGVKIEVARSLFDEVDDGEYYVCDLEGCSVFLGGEARGVVKTVTHYPTCDVLVVTQGRTTLEVPLQAAYVDEVDLEARTITLHTVDGLE